MAWLMFLHFERICARIPRSGLISFQFQVNFATVLLFSWTVSWCVCVCGLSFISDSVCVCECLRANVDAICTFGSVLMYFQVWICFCQVRISDHLLSSKAAFANKSGVENSVCVCMCGYSLTNSQDFFFHLSHDLLLHKH